MGGLGDAGRDCARAAVEGSSDVGDMSGVSCVEKTAGAEAGEG
jgi:hypothetical protein